MRFRPCIDIHNGKVKQIIGGTLRDEGDAASTNFSSEKDAAYYADLYRKDGLLGGHIILLNAAGSGYFTKTKEQAKRALRAWPGGMQIGGGINADNALSYLRDGASHVIVTSFVFQDGTFRKENLEKLREKVGKSRIVLDLSCRKRNGKYVVVTDRWQKFTNVELNADILDMLADYCDEFLIHGVDVEGRRSGMEEELVRILAQWDGIPVTYAGGIGTEGDLEHFFEVSRGKLDVTIGSALDLFGGNIPYNKVKKIGLKSAGGNGDM